MNIIKEYVKRNGTNVIAAIRTNTYSHTLKHFDMLFDIAKADFPTITKDDVRVVQYAGTRFKRTYGIEFKLDSNNAIPETYFEIKELELTF